MAKPLASPVKSHTVGDSAVEGLLYGLVAGLAMALFLVTARWLAGDAPDVTLSHFGTAGTALPLVGALSHLATAAVYGMMGGIILSMARRALRLPAWLLGLAYGLLLWVVAERLLLAAVASPLADFPPLHLALAHALYGLTLGYLSGRMGR